MYFFKRFLIGCLLLCVCHAAPYVPGEPGGSWTESELSVVKAKLYAVYSRSNDVMTSKIERVIKIEIVLKSEKNMILEERFNET